MEPSKLALQDPRISDKEEPIGEPLCPICESYTIPIRGLLRCRLCGFVLCESCEGTQTGTQA